MTEPKRETSHCQGSTACMGRNAVDLQGRSRPMTRSARLAHDTTAIVVPFFLMMCACGSASRSATAPAEPAPSQSTASAAVSESASVRGAHPFGESAPEALLGMFISATPRAHMQQIMASSTFAELNRGGHFPAERDIKNLLDDQEDPPLVGFDLEKPLYILLIDVAGSSELVFVPAVRDPKLADELLSSVGVGSSEFAIRHANGYVAISRSQAAVDLIGDYALGDLLAESLPEEPAIVARMPSVMRRYGSELPMLLRVAMTDLHPEMSRKLREPLLGLLERLARESRLAWLTMEDGPEHFSIRLRVEADPASDVASFIRAQRPNDFAAAHGFAVEGDLAFIAGELQEAGSSLSMPGLLTMFMPSTQGATPDYIEFAKTWHALATLSSGGGAMVCFKGERDTMQCGMRNAVHDTARARELLKSLMLPAKSSGDVAVREIRIGDIPVYLHRQPLPGSGAEIRIAAAVADGHVWFLYGPDSEQLIERALAGAMRNRVEHPTITQARRHGESLVLHVDQTLLEEHMEPSIKQDITTKPGISGISLGLGFRDDTVWLRLRVPVALFRGMRADAGGNSFMPESKKESAGPLPGENEQTQGESKPEGMSPQVSCMGDSTDPQVISRPIRQNLPRIASCYDRARLKSPELAGMVMTEFQIGPLGTVSHATAQGVSDELASCVVDVIKTIQFPKSCSGETTLVRYPIKFHPPEAATPASP